MLRSLQYDLRKQRQLPPCRGPKLKAFRDRRQPVEFLELISNPRSVDEEEPGGHGHVFKVRIKGKIFALKVFRFFDAEEERREIGLSWSSRVSSNEVLTFHSDPFFAECRAYGKIHEYGHSEWIGARSTQRSERDRKRHSAADDVAVPCYGYMALPFEQNETILRNQFGIEGWNRPEKDQEQDSDSKQPFRALVKEFIDSDFDIKKPGKMLRDLKRLNEMGIYQKDVRAANYKNGLLVDFSVACTEPHWRIDMLEGDLETLEIWKDGDLYEFDNMIRDEGIKTYVRAKPNLQYTRKLRSHPYTYYETSSEENDN